MMKCMMLITICEHCLTVERTFKSDECSFLNLSLVKARWMSLGKRSHIFSPRLNGL